jgi:hypothetical protein
VTKRTLHLTAEQLVTELVRLGPEALPPFLRGALKTKARTKDDTKALARFDELMADDFLRKDAISLTADEFCFNESDKNRLRRKLRERRIAA